MSCMRSVIQRVTRASVGIGGRKHSEIGPGLVLLLGIGESDDNSDVEWLAAKIVAAQDLQRLQRSYEPIRNGYRR